MVEKQFFAGTPKGNFLICRKNCEKGRVFPVANIDEKEPPLIVGKSASRIHAAAVILAIQPILT